MNTILVFDVETTGLLPRLKKGEKEKITDDLPYIIQLSFILYDIRNTRIIKSYNAYVKPQSNVLIPEKIVQLTGITNEMIDNEGEDIVDVLVELYEAYSECDAVIAHNLEFDSRMVNIETERNYSRLEYEIAPYIHWMFDELYCKLTYVKLQCTMLMSVKLCNIQKTNSFGKYMKFPTLCELYMHLFNKTPENLHNSMMDVLVCLRCYLKIELQKNITDATFADYVERCF